MSIQPNTDNFLPNILLIRQNFGQSLAILRRGVVSILKASHRHHGLTVSIAPDQSGSKGEGGDGEGGGDDGPQRG